MSNQKQIPLIVVCGPTASGKTKLAIDLAKEYGGEIISADSMQIYKYMSIGTAKPTTEEMDNIPHHLIDFLEPDQSFSVAEYCNMAKDIILDLTKQNKIPIVAGGTGLYINSLVENIAFSDIGQSQEIRDELYLFAQENGNEALFKYLEDIDTNICKTIHFNNLPRVVRAIEIYRLTGKNMSWHIENSKLKPSRYNAVIIGLTYSDRQKLYDRINKRVDIMVENGLLKEAKWLFDGKYKGTAMQAIGYKELKGYFFDNIDLETCLDKIKMESRRYAKRQLTWFRKNQNVNWIEVDNFTDYDEILSLAKEIIAKRGILDNFLI